MGIEICSANIAEIVTEFEVHLRTSFQLGEAKRNLHKKMDELSYPETQMVA